MIFLDLLSFLTLLLLESEVMKYFWKKTVKNLNFPRGSSKVFYNLTLWIILGDHVARGKFKFL
jgi:hypothetical protein